MFHANQGIRDCRRLSRERAKIIEEDINCIVEVPKHACLFRTMQNDVSAHRQWLSQQQHHHNTQQQQQHQRRRNSTTHHHHQHKSLTLLDYANRHLQHLETEEQYYPWIAPYATNNRHIIEALKTLPFFDDSPYRMHDADQRSFTLIHDLLVRMYHHNISETIAAGGGQGVDETDCATTTGSSTNDCRHGHNDHKKYQMDAEDCCLEPHYNESDNGLPPSHPSPASSSMETVGDSSASSPLATPPAVISSSTTATMVVSPSTERTVFNGKKRMGRTELVAVATKKKKKIIKHENNNIQDVVRNVESAKVARTKELIEEARKKASATSSSTVLLPKAFTYTGKTVVPDDVERVIIHSSVKVIEKDAFKNCKQLVSISIPKTVKTIRASAFLNCSALQDFRLANGGHLTTIGPWAFGGCASLESITIPKSCTTIHNYAFYGCTKLETFQVATTRGCNLKSIGASAFQDCRALRTIKIPSTVTLGTNAYPKHLQQRQEEDEVVVWDVIWFGTGKPSSSATHTQSRRIRLFSPSYFLVRTYESRQIWLNLTKLETAVTIH